MSSLNNLRAIATSSVFRSTLLASAFFILSAALIGGLYGWRQLTLANAEEQVRLEEEVLELIEFVEEDGLQHVLEEHENEFGLLWPEEEAQHLLEEEHVLFLISQNDDPVMGFANLPSGPNGSWHDYRAEGEDWEIRIFSATGDDGVRVTGALSHTHDYWQAVEFIRSGFFWLLIIVAPLAVITGFLLSRQVLGQIQEISEAVGKIAAGDLNARAPVSEADNEFDRLSTDINAMLHQIHDLMRSLENVTVGAAHDLKTPLTRLDQRLQHLEQQAGNPEAVRQHVEAAQENVQTLLNTFNALLRLGEIDSGKRRSQFDVVPISELTQDVAETYEVVFQEQGRGLNVSVLPGLRIAGDINLLAQLISNLLENILEHANPTGKAWVRLQPQRKLNNQYVSLQIGDDGPGIPDAEHEQIFERFYRLDKSRNTPGNGLGLSLVASIARLHGAEIEVHKNQPGTVIEITFPT